ncbi:PepSY domain-containing protein [Salinisphaera sp. T31B1]|uniref:PepSY domain-containing protein n=1 Tax=Salinisphaera sp. T31B1 TaxID=727963 RepID=UPI003341595F
MINDRLSQLAAVSSLAMMAITAPAIAKQNADLVPLEQCIESARSVRQGDIVKVEFLSVSPAGAPTYEIEIRDNDDTEWELMCNARTGDIYELETEADSPQDEAFARQAKITEAQARQTVIDRFGGEIVEVEYEIESDGSPTYEIDVAQDGQDNELKVEVDAVTGDIIELSVETWQIGHEPSEEVDGGAAASGSPDSGT